MALVINTTFKTQKFIAITTWIEFTLGSFALTTIEN